MLGHNGHSPGTAIVFGDPHTTFRSPAFVALGRKLLTLVTAMVRGRMVIHPSRCDHVPASTGRIGSTQPSCPALLPRFDCHFLRHTIAPFEISSFPKTSPSWYTRNSTFARPSSRRGCSGSIDLREIARGRGSSRWRRIRPGLPAWQHSPRRARRRAGDQGSPRGRCRCRCEAHRRRRAAPSRRVCPP
jgi:hypothetical protein